MPRFVRALLVSASALAFYPATADAAMSPLVVTATRSLVPLNEIASSMTVISAEEIAQKNKSAVADLLREVPGITVANNGGVGQTTRVFMRGANSNHVLVMIDGVIVNDPSDPGDAFDFSNLTTDNIERIEVLRGPQSTLYGSEAIGGVINVITKQGKGTPGYSGFAEVGRYHSRREGVGSSGEIGRTAYSVTLSNSHTDGISTFAKKYGAHEKDSNNAYTAAANIASRLTDNFTAKLNARYNRSQTEFDSPGAFTRPGDDRDPQNDSRQFNGRMSGELSLLGGDWTQELGISTLNVNRDQVTVYYDTFGSEIFGRQQQFGWRQTMDWVHHIKIMPGNMLTMGVEGRSDHFKTQDLSEVNADSRAMFADDQFTIGNFFMNTGIRFDDHQAFGREFTWKIAPGYRIDATGTTLKATYGTGFKAPSLSQLYDPIYGNAALVPEKSRGWDVGFEQEMWGDMFVFGTTLFRNDIRQLIGNASLPPYGTLNVGKARTEGAETVFTLKPSADWTASAGHTYTLSQDRAANVELLRRPRHQINANATWRYSDVGDVGANVRYLSSRRDINIYFPYNKLYVKSFTTLDLVTNYKITKAVTLYSRLDNVLDKRNEEVFAYGQPGRALYAGVKANF